jgi:hypothetical protein
MLAAVGLILAVGVPITIAVAFDIDLGKQPAVMGGGMMPGIVVMAVAGKLWKGGAAVKPRPDQIPPGYEFCDLCGETVPETEGSVQRLNPRTPMARVWAKLFPRPPLLSNSCAVTSPRRQYAVGSTNGPRPTPAENRRHGIGPRLPG